MKYICNSIEKLMNGTETIGKKLLCTSIPLSLLLSSTGTTSFAERGLDMEPLTPSALVNASEAGEELPAVAVPTYFSDLSFYSSDDEANQSFNASDDEQNPVMALLKRVKEKIVMERRRKGRLNEFNDLLLNGQIEDFVYNEEELLYAAEETRQELRWVKTEINVLKSLVNILSRLQNMECTPAEQEHLLDRVDSMFHRIRTVKFIGDEEQENLKDELRGIFNELIILEDQYSED